jgi:aminodeoxyfutalosine deaminase
MTEGRRTETASRSVIHRARWVLPIDRAPVEGGWVESENGRITRVGAGTPPAPAEDLGDVALLPGLVNAHTHLELSWMAGLVPPAPSMNDWIGALVQLRRAGVPGGNSAELEAARAAVRTMAATGVVLIGDITNTGITGEALRGSDITGVMFYELLGFNAADPEALVRAAWKKLEAVDTDLKRAVVAHAPYSVSPDLFRAIAAQSIGAPLSVHLGESAEEIEFLRTGRGPIRETLERLGVWSEGWPVPDCDPVRFLADLGYLRAGLLVVHGVHLTDDGLERLRGAGAVLVTCPRSNLWVGAGAPRLAHFYAARLPVAIGTDSLASVATLSLFDELAEMRRLAPEVAAGTLLASATRIGAEALGFGKDYGTIAPGKRPGLVAVSVPARERDVEEYLVGGVAPDAIKRVA